MASSAHWLLILAALFSFNSATPLPTDGLSAYQILQRFDFLVGILPKGVTGYDIDTETGKFKLYLPETWKFSIESYQLEYGTA